MVLAAAPYTDEKIWSIIIIITKNESSISSIDFKVAATAAAGKVKVSHAAVKSFDRRGVSCKNARTRPLG